VECCGSVTVIDNRKWYKYVCITTNQPDTKCNTLTLILTLTKQHTVVKIQLNIVTYPIRIQRNSYETCCCTVCTNIDCHCNTAGLFWWYNVYSWTVRGCGGRHDKSVTKSNQTNYIIARPEIDQRAGRRSLQHVGITKTEKNIELKHKTDEQISPVDDLESWDQSERQKQTKEEDKIFWKGRFWAQSETVNKWWKVIAVCSKLNRHTYHSSHTTSNIRAVSLSVSSFPDCGWKGTNYFRNVLGSGNRHPILGIVHRHSLWLAHINCGLQAQ